MTSTTCFGGAIKLDASDLAVIISIDYFDVDYINIAQ